MRYRRFWILAVPLLLAAGSSGARAAASPGLQQAAWNGSRALDLAEKAIRARRPARAAESIRNFEAHAQGHVYFLARVSEEGTEKLVRADQVALRIRYQAPDRAVQTILGRRSEKRLPTGIRYHIDHLGVILDNFEDRIAIGEGAEVRDVLHPAAPGALARYDYRLGDSLGLSVAGRSMRLRRLEVRPKDSRLPGVVGELFVEEESGAIVRMRGTFTGSAYRDPQLERIDFDLQSALWEGRHWLPAEQTVEVRRKLRWLNFPLMSLIRTHMVVSGYRINENGGFVPVPGRRIASLPEGMTSAFDDWGSGLYEGPVSAGAREGPDAEEARRRARKMVGPGALRMAAPVGLHYPDVSHALRARRAEGVLAGAGGRFRPAEAWDLTAWTGVPMATGAVQWRLEVSREIGETRLEAEAFGDRLTDIGPFRAAGGLVSTLGFLTGGEDFTDPYFRDGGRLGIHFPAAGGEAELSLGGEHHASARLAALPPGDARARPVRGVTDGTLVALRAGYRPPEAAFLSTRWTGKIGFEAAAVSLGDFGFTRTVLELRGESERAGDPLQWEVGAGLGAAGGTVPPQRLLLTGGRGTVPGHGFRGRGGNLAAHVNAAISREIIGPWLRLRALAAAGWADVGGPARAAARRLEVTGGGGIRSSLGGGVGLLDGMLRIDVARGFGEGGRWEWMVSADPGLWPML